MSISQILFDAIQAMDAELKKPGEYGTDLHEEIKALISRMKDIQRQLDSERTEMDAGEED